MAASRRNDAPGNIRAGRLVISSRTNVLSDSGEEMQASPLSVRIMIRRKDGKFLCVIDHKNSFRIGFPGGGVDVGESPADAAVRELWEETGLISDDLRLIDIATFMDTKIFLFLSKNHEGRLKSSEEGRSTWCSATSLTSGHFGEYYSNLFKKLGIS